MLYKDVVLDRFKKSNNPNNPVRSSTIFVVSLFDPRRNAGQEFVVLFVGSKARWGRCNEAKRIERLAEYTHRDKELTQQY